MLNTLKRPPSAAPDSAETAAVSGRLMECHDRIRHFLDVSDRLSLQSLDGVPESEIRDAALGLHRYFSQAVGLHVQDEQETIEPRLRGREAAVDAALDVMLGQHSGLDEPLARFITLVAELAAEPSRHEALRKELEPLAIALRSDLITHMAAEELVILPAIDRNFDAATQAVMVGEMQQRRTV